MRRVPDQDLRALVARYKRKRRGEFAAELDVFRRPEQLERQLLAARRVLVTALRPGAGEVIRTAVVPLRRANG